MVFSWVKTFNGESDSSGITDLCSGCGRPHNAHPTAKINKVKDLALIFLSAQCYAWTEYKFTCVVCNHTLLCVSVTLSVNSPTGQTPQWILTVDSLKDGDLREDVPFGCLDDK